MISNQAWGNEDYTQGDEHRLNMVLAITSRLYAMHRDVHNLYAGIAAEASGLAKAEKCSLMMPVESREMLRVRAATGCQKDIMDAVWVRSGEGISGMVFEKGEPVLIASEEQIRRHAVEPKTTYKTASALSLPLKLDNEVIGVLNLADKSTGQPFTETDLSLLKLFACQASLILKLSNCHVFSEEMRELSVTDYLTGLLNRRYFNIRIEEEYQRVLRGGGPFSLALIDIDNFKLFNDTEGHSAGDMILKGLAAAMKQTLRAKDILVRYGGEEFAVIMPDTFSSEAFAVAERMRHAARTVKPFDWGKYPKKNITLSLGVETCRNPASSVDHYIDNADKALYIAKLGGKDRTIIYDDHKQSASP